jgi:hypothetical protein
LRQEWASRITDAQLLRVMGADEIFSEVTAVYDNYVNALETGSVEALRAYARDLSGRVHPPRRGGAGRACPDGGGGRGASAALPAPAAFVAASRIEAGA